MPLAFGATITYKNDHTAFDSPLRESRGISSQSTDFTATVPVPKSYQNHTVKTQLFMCLPPACFEAGFGFVSGFEEGLVEEFSKKKIRKLAKL